MIDWRQAIHRVSTRGRRAQGRKHPCARKAPAWPRGRASCGCPRPFACRSPERVRGPAPWRPVCRHRSRTAPR